MEFYILKGTGNLEGYQLLSAWEDEYNDKIIEKIKINSSEFKNHLPKEKGELIELSINHKSRRTPVFLWIDNYSGELRFGSEPGKIDLYIEDLSECIDELGFIEYPAKVDIKFISKIYYVPLHNFKEQILHKRFVNVEDLENKLGVPIGSIKVEEEPFISLNNESKTQVSNFIMTLKIIAGDIVISYIKPPKYHEIYVTDVSTDGYIADLSGNC